MKKILTLTLAFGLLFPAVPLNAATITTLTADAEYGLGGKTLILKAGSAYESLSTSDTSMTLTIPSDEAVELRTPGLYPAVLENDGGLANCNVLKVRDNQLVVTGPRTITVTPSQTNCDITGYDTDNTTLFTLTNPAGGTTLNMNQQYQLFWSTDGATAAVRLRLSLDGGQTYDRVIADNLINNGYYNWTVPEVVTTSQARLKIEGWNAGQIVAMTIGELFTIQGTEPPAPEPTEPEEPTYNYDPAAATAAAASIGADKNLPTASLPSGTVTCHSNSLIKSLSSSGVYYCGRDGFRYVFPNEKTYSTWYTDFAGVIIVSETDLAAIPLGGNVTYRPGVRMVKITTDPKVYAVAPGGVLRPIASEAVAAALYGPNWNQLIDDVPDAFFVNYTVGEPIE